MKKIIACLFTLFLVVGLFATVTPESVIEKIESLDFWCFDKKLSEGNDKAYINIRLQSATDFTRITRNSLDRDLYPNQHTMTFDEVKSVFKSCNNLMFGYSYSTIAKYYWKEGKELSYSVQYTQIKTGPIECAGTYVIRVFFEDSVLTILLQDSSTYIEQKKDYKILNELCFYKDGNLLDKSKGTERTKGYYWKNEESIKTFYNMLKNKNSSLPKSAINFQTGVEKIFEILDSYK
ncbi:MAG: hypothetical protein UH788_06155 [Treponemataceae bacterium]|nr:hypothetical protein [Spirochaetaceae bacterium]MEE0878840.1 hypothetical protein [Treponemataceae bacterium]